MTTQHGPARPWSEIETWVFDLDNTLYPASCNLFVEVDQRMTGYISNLLGMSAAEATALRRRYYLEHGTTLSGLMQHHIVDPHEFLTMVHDLDYSPVTANPRLDRALADLPGRKIVFTNGTTAHAEAVLNRLGVPHHFEAIFDVVAADFVPKPRPEPYDKFLRTHGVNAASAAMLEDMAKNLLHPHALGMTTVWMRGSHAWSDGEAAVTQDSSHIHHIADDIADFLETVLADLADRPVSTPG